MIDGILAIASFLAGAILALSISSYYNNKICELMREMMGKQRKSRPREDEVNEGK